MFAAGLIVGVIVGLVIGVIYAVQVRSSEHKAVAKTLAQFAAVDQEARSLVMRCYRHLADGIRKELDRLLPR